jgi:hypothetical protein
MLFRSTGSLYCKRETSKVSGNPYIRLRLNKDEITQAMGDNSVLDIRIMDDKVHNDKNGNPYFKGYVSSWTPSKK